jgi:hypothetical protein
MTVLRAKKGESVIVGTDGKRIRTKTDERWKRSHAASSTSAVARWDASHN